MGAGAIANAASNAGKAAQGAQAAQQAGQAAQAASNAGKAAQGAQSATQGVQAAGKTAIPGNATQAPAGQAQGAQQGATSSTQSAGNKQTQQQGVEQGGGTPGEAGGSVGQPPKEKKIKDEQKAAHSQGEAPEGSKKGDKLGDGKEVDENGQIQDSATKKTAKAAGRVVARVYGGEAGGQAADAILASKVGDKVIGTAADVADKTVPGLKQASQELEKAGAADGVNDALDTFEKAKSGDLKGAVESAKKVKSDLKKTKKYILKKMLIGILITSWPLLLFLIIVVAVTGAEQGGIIDQNGNYLGETPPEEETGGGAGGGGGGQTGGGEVPPGEGLNITPVDDAVVQAACAQVPGFNTFSTKRKGIIAASELAIRSHIPYLWGGKPSGPGISGLHNGLDCSGFVQWTLWTGTGEKPGTLGTSTMVSNIGKLFEEISESELKPGDIGLKHKSSGTNHTGIYAGNGQWYHSPQTGEYIKKSNYSNFKYFLRYKGVDS